MLNNLGWSEILILLLLGLVIFGPERLPGIIASTIRTFTQVRDHLAGITQQIHHELGPEIEELQEPLRELNYLRTLTPTNIIKTHFASPSQQYPMDPQPVISPPPPFDSEAT